MHKSRTGPIHNISTSKNNFWGTMVKKIFIEKLIERIMQLKRIRKPQIIQYLATQLPINCKIVRICAGQASL